MSGAVRAAFFGDSLTLGAGDRQGLGWVGRLSVSARAQGQDLTAYNLGVRRETSADIARRWEGEASARLPATSGRLLVFSFGTNDCLEEDGQRRVPHDRSLATARALLSSAVSFAPVLMIGPPPAADASENLRIGALSRGLASLCAQLDISFLELFAPLRAAGDWMSSLADGYHPGEAGYALAACIIEASAQWSTALDAARGQLIEELAHVG